MNKTLLAASLASAYCGHAAAQSLDYAGLEQLFGEPVTTSVTGSPQRASDVPAAMQIIDADEIRRSGARDLPGLLRHVAGVDVLQSTMSHADVSVRGYNQAFAPRLLVLVDGRQVYADYYGFTPWDAIPVELAAIRQVEVVRGPNSALFGFNAVGGVINIITYDPADDMTSSVTAIAGTQDVRELSAVSGWKFGEAAGLRLSVGRRENDDFGTPQRAADVGTRRGDRREAANLEGGFRFNENVSADFEATYSDAPHTELGPVYWESFTHYATDSLKAHVAAETPLGLIEGTVYTNDTVADVFNDVQPVPFLVLDNEVSVARVESLSKLGTAQTLRLSIEQRHTDMTTTPIGGAEVFYDVTSVSGMWEWSFADALVLTNAVRFDDLALGRRGFTPSGYPLTNADWDRSMSEASLNSGLVWRISDGDVLRFMVARGAQLPTLFNLGGLLIELPAGYVTGVPWLEPTIVTSYEVGWSRALPGLGASLRVSAYKGRTQDIVASVGGAQFALGLVGIPVNVGDSRVSGLEIALDGSHENWRWGASYTLVAITDDFISGYTVTTTQTEFEHTTPRSVLNGNLGWARGPWEIDGYVRYQSSFQGITSYDNTINVGVLEPVHSFVSVDARVGYQINHRITVALAGQGITHGEQRQNASAPSVERRIYGSFQVTF